MDAGLVRVGEAWSYWKGVTPPPGAILEWTRPGYLTGSGWLSGPSGFSNYHGSRDDEATLFIDRNFNYLSVFFRREFVVRTPADVAQLVLRIDFQEGFVAYLNGVEILRQNLVGVPGVPVPFDAAAEIRTNVFPVEFDVSPFASLLAPGTNVLAIQVHSDRLEPGFPFRPYGGDLRMTAELVANFTRGPYVAHVTADSATLVWRTPGARGGEVEWGRAGEPVQRRRLPGAEVEQVAVLEGLEPGSTYVYRVRSGGGGAAWTDAHAFTTHPRSGGLRFAVVGDTGRGSVVQHRIASALRSSGAAFVLHTGDVVYSGFVASKADTRCFSVYQPMMASVPWYFVLGNHEIYGSVNGIDFVQNMWLPTNAVPMSVHQLEGTSPEHFYSFDAGDVHVVALYNPQFALYTFGTNSAQYAWLEADLAASTKPWKVIFQHIPVRTSGQHRFNYGFVENPLGLYDRERLQATLVPLAARHGVQLILNGHDHFFERFVPERGVHALTTGAGGVELYSVLEWDALSAQQIPEHHFMVIDVEGDTMQLRAVNTTGTTIDEFFIQREVPARREWRAAWEEVAPAPEPVPLAPPNRAGQRFELSGEPIPSKSGSFANLGRLRVSLDNRALHLGFEHLMLPGDAEAIAFLGVEGRRGVGSLEGLGDGGVEFGVEGMEALDQLDRLAFAGFEPFMAFVMGDERADATDRFFQRYGAAIPGGQGAVHLAPGFPEVAGVRIEQFDRSPQDPSRRLEPSADFVTVSIPRQALPGLRGDERIRVGVVATRGDFWGTNRWVDSGFIGVALHGGTEGPWVLEPVEIRLPGDLDTDDDGLLDIAELEVGTDPWTADTDGDGMEDGWEVDHGLDPRSALGEDGAGGDKDGDGVANRVELAVGANPSDARSSLSLLVRRFGVGGAIQLEWPVPSFGGLVLESALEPAGVFEEQVTAPPIVVAGRNRVLVSSLEERRYFRLRWLEPR